MGRFGLKGLILQQVPGFPRPHQLGPFFVLGAVG